MFSAAPERRYGEASYGTSRPGKYVFSGSEGLEREALRAENKSICHEGHVASYVGGSGCVWALRLGALVATTP